jgi:hypothetical protein
MMRQRACPVSDGRETFPVLIKKEKRPLASIFQEALFGGIQQDSEDNDE